MISIIIPVYNEARVLKNSLKKLEEHLGMLDSDYEIILAEDGSTDGTDRACIVLAKKNKKIRHLHSDEKRGKGKAIKEGLAAAKGDIMIFTDIDLSTDLRDLPKLIKEINNGSQICIGSRMLPESEKNRTFIRELASRVYNQLAGRLFGIKITDLQCGFKALKREALPVALAAENDEWSWDTEMLIIADRLGLKISQIPIKWSKTPESKIRIFEDSFGMFLDLMRMKTKFSDKKRMDNLLKDIKSQMRQES